MSDQNPVDVWEALLLESAYGELRIDITAIQTSEGNDLVRHEFPRRDGAEIDHQGNRSRTTRCTVVFFETVDNNAKNFVTGENANNTGEVKTSLDVNNNHIARYKAFRALCHDGKTHRFVHPFIGEYDARVEEFDTTADANTRDWIQVNCSFVEQVQHKAVFDGVGIQKTAGVDAVDAAAQAARDALDDAEIDSDLPELAQATVLSWQDRGIELSSREVNVELATFSKDFQDALDELELATDIDSYLPIRQLTLLHYQMARAAETFVQQTSRIIEVTVTAATPLRVLASRIYGADQSDTRYQEILELNDIRRPGLIPAGTIIKAESPLQDLRTRTPR